MPVGSSGSFSKLGTHACAAVLVFALSGCRSSGSSTAKVVDAAAAPTVSLPQAAPELAGLSFLAGRWAAVNPNQSVNREHWMSPSGKTMSGLFQQLRRDGSAAFYEVSVISVEPDGVKLYHRHMHRGLAIDERRKDIDVFRLRSVEPGRAVFEPVTGDAAGPAGIESMTYRTDGADTLVQEVAFRPDSKEKPFSTVYSREK